MPFQAERPFGATICSLPFVPLAFSDRDALGSARALSPLLFQVVSALALVVWIHPSLTFFGRVLLGFFRCCSLIPSL